jgi:hypothetical protein
MYPGARVGIHKSAASCRQHVRRFGQQPCDDLAFPRRKAGSPKRSKISLMVHPAASSISASASRKGTPKVLAKRRPTDVLPAPIMPTRTSVLSSLRMGFAYTGSGFLG